MTPVSSSTLMLSRHSAALVRYPDRSTNKSRRDLSCYDLQCLLRCNCFGRPTVQGEERGPSPVMRNKFATASSSSGRRRRQHPTGRLATAKAESISIGQRHTARSLTAVLPDSQHPTANTPPPLVDRSIGWALVLILHFYSARESNIRAVSYDIAVDHH
jgi:hypothetical protein